MNVNLRMEDMETVEEPEQAVAVQGLRAYPNPASGAFTLQATEEGKALMQWPEMVYQFHREGFSLPKDATLLGAAETYPNQAFRYGENAGGIQFHCQMVVVPGINDGEVLEKTLVDLWNMGDAVPTVAIVPVGTLDGAKSRLGAVLDAEERLELTKLLARRTISAAIAARGVTETIVVTPDDAVRDLASELGARALRQRDGGLNRGIDAAREEATASGAEAVVILPVDLPDITSAAVEAVLAPLADPDRPLVAIVADRHGRGTNALLVSPPNEIDPAFGDASRAAHAARATAVGATWLELDGPLSLDLDTPADLIAAEAAIGSLRG